MDLVSPHSTPSFGIDSSSMYWILSCISIVTSAVEDLFFPVLIRYSYASFVEMSIQSFSAFSVVLLSSCKNVYVLDTSSFSDIYFLIVLQVLYQIYGFHIIPFPVDIFFPWFRLPTVSYGLEQMSFLLMVLSGQ